MSFYSQRKVHFLQSIRSQYERVQSDINEVRSWKLKDSYLTQDERNIQKTHHMMRLRICLFSSFLWPGLRKGLIHMQRVSLKHQHILDPNKFFDKVGYGLNPNEQHGDFNENNIDEDGHATDEDVPRIGDALTLNMPRRQRRGATVEIIVDRPRRLAVGELRLDGITCLSDVNPNEILGSLSNIGTLYYRISLSFDCLTTIWHLIARCYADSLRENSGPYECYMPKFAFLALKYPSLNSWFAIDLGIFNIVSRVNALMKEKLELDVLIFMLSSYEEIQANMSCEKARQRFENMGSLNVIQKVLFYKYQSPKQQIEFRLRPNRSWETKRLLHKLFYLMTPLTTIFGALALYVPVYAYVGIYQYELFYKNCQIIYSQGPIYWFQLIINFLYSTYVIYQTESCHWALTFICLLIFYDLTLYREDIEARLGRIEKAIDDLNWIDRKNSTAHKMSHSIRPQASNQDTMEFDDINGSKTEANSCENSLNIPMASSQDSQDLATKNDQGLLNYNDNDDQQQYQQQQQQNRHLGRRRPSLQRQESIRETDEDDLDQVNETCLLMQKSNRSPGLELNANKRDKESKNINTRYNYHDDNVGDDEDDDNENRSFASPQEEIADFQARCTDFFQNVNRGDEMVSHTLGCLFLFYIVSNFTIVIVELSRSWINGYTQAKVIQVFAGPFLMLMCSPAMRFNRGNIRLYKQICTFMARDPTRAKTNWIGVLRYYTDNQRYAFTLFGIEILSNQTFLRYCSYILSFTSFMATADFG